MHVFSKNLALCLLASLTLWVSNASAQMLWRDIPAGASKADVIRIIPGALPPAEESAPGPKGELGSRLETPPFDVAGDQFTALFVFYDDKLNRVLLNPLAKPSKNLARVKAMNLATTISAQYGAPSEVFDSQEHGSTYHVTWWKGQTRIVLSMSDLQGSDGPHLYIGYFHQPVDPNL